MAFQIRNSKHRDYLNLGIHILIWGLIFNIPFSSTNPPTNTVEYFLRTCPYLLFAILFYTNYLFLVSDFLFTKRYTLFIACNICAYVLGISALIQLPTWEVFDGIERKGPPFDLEFVLRVMISLVTMTGIAVAIRTTARWFQSENLHKDLEKEHLKSELVNLKNQLNPHFFFNTLNTIYGLIIQNQELAQDAVHRLSKLMRYLLYDSNEKHVSLTKEIDFIRHYVDLMQLRSQPNLKVSCNFPKIDPELKITPLLFVSLIENAFKHGISTSQNSEITIQLSLEGEQLIFTLRNTDFAKNENDKSGSGIGLKNLEKRLKLLYKDRHTLEFGSENGIFKSTLTLNI